MDEQRHRDFTGLMSLLAMEWTNKYMRSWIADMPQERLAGYLSEAVSEIKRLREANAEWEAWADELS